MPRDRDQEQEGPEFNIRDITETLRRRKWVIIQAFVFVSIIGLVTASLSPPVYATGSRMMVRVPTGNQVILTNVGAADPLSPLTQIRMDMNLSTQLEILRSGRFANLVRTKVAPEFASAPVSLSYQEQTSTQIINISAEGSDPQACAAWANAVPIAYTELTEESNNEYINKTTKYLEDQTRVWKTRLEKADKQLVDFKQKYQPANSPGEGTARLEDALRQQEKARELKGRLASLDTEIKIVSAQVEKMEPFLAAEPEPNPALTETSAKITQLEAEKARMMAIFQPGSQRVQEVDEQIENLKGYLEKLPPTVTRGVQRANPDYVTLQKQVRDKKVERETVQQTLATIQVSAVPAQKQVNNFGAWQVQMEIIEREREVASKSYLDFADKLRTMQLKEQVGMPKPQVMETAGVPGAPVRPNRPQQVMLSMVMGLMLGVGFAFLQEFLDDRVNTSEDIERVTSLATLGVVPTIPEDSNRLLIGHDALSPVTESYRSLRTGVIYSSVDRPIHTMIVTSAHPGEGKSVTSANLGIAIALQGKRVILIDADLRRPSAHRLFRVEAEPGLTSVLAGEVSLDDALHTTAIDGFKVLTSGPLPPNPPELLNSQSMMDLLDHLKEIADLVIIDTPPVIPVTDAQVLASHVDGVVLVVEAGQARKASIKHARDLLEQTRGRILGVVLNKIDQSSKGYYYHYYYRGGYRKYGKKKRGYGGYGYGAGYGYGGGYGYGNGYGYGQYGGQGQYGYGQYGGGYGNGYGYGGGYGGRGRHKLGHSTEDKVPGEGVATAEREGEGGEREQSRKPLPGRLSDWD